MNMPNFDSDICVLSTCVREKKTDKFVITAAYYLFSEIILHDHQSYFDRLVKGEKESPLSKSTCS